MPSKSRKSSVRTKANPAAYYRYPLAPRRTPQKPPTVGIFDSPCGCTKINNQWLSHIIGVLGVLTEEDAWKGAPNERYYAQQEIEKLLNQLKDDSGCDGFNDEPFCTEYAPDNPKIEWNPNNPHAEAPLSPPPDGYASYPWYLGRDQPLSGINDTDVLCDVNSLRPEDLTWGLEEIVFRSGLPRFRFHFSGTGTLELHLLKMIQGGYAIIRIDDNLLSTETVDLQGLSADSLLDLTQLLLELFESFTFGDLIPTYIYEREITTPGDHFVDVLIFPKATLNLLEVGWGGGLRKITWCRNDIPISSIITSVEVRECDILITYGDGRTEIISLTELIQRCKTCPECPPLPLPCPPCDDDDDCGCCDDDEQPPVPDCGCCDDEQPIEDCGCCDEDEPVVPISPISNQDCGCE